MAALSAQMDADARTKAWGEGRAMSIEQAIQFALAASDSA